MDAPEVVHVHRKHKHPQHERGGRNWLDALTTLCALGVSGVSLWVAIHHGETMEKLVQANSLPNVEIGVSIVEGRTPDAVVFAVDVENTGVGPARIESVTVAGAAKALRSPRDVLAAIRANVGAPVSAELGVESVTGSLIGAGKKKRMFSLAIKDGRTIFPALLKTASELKTAVCYCSVFDDCYRVESASTRPKAVKSCPAEADGFDQSMTDFVDANSGAPSPQ